MKLKRIIFIVFIILFVIFLSIFGYLYFFQDNKIPVLTYHDVVDSIDKNDIYTVNISMEKFKKQIAWLNKNGYNTITMDELYNWKESNW